MDMEAGILLYLLIAFQQFTSALEIQVIALMQLYAVFYAVLSLSITGYIPAPEYPEMYDSADSCLFSKLFSIYCIRQLQFFKMDIPPLVICLFIYSLNFSLFVSSTVYIVVASCSCF